jgi:hypothetical protein
MQDFKKRVDLFFKGYKDPQWQKLRLEVLNRDGWSCVSCGAKEKNLHVHHPVYHPYSDHPWEYEPDFLVTLCEDCHSDEHIDLKSSQAHVLMSLIPLGIHGGIELDAFSDFLNSFSKDEFQELIAARMRGH